MISNPAHQPPRGLNLFMATRLRSGAERMPRLTSRVYKGESRNIMSQKIGFFRLNPA